MNWKNLGLVGVFVLVTYLCGSGAAEYLVAGEEV